MSSLPGSGQAAAENNVELIAKRLLRFGGLPIELRDQASAGLFIGRAIENRIKTEQRIAGKIHLRDEARGEGGPEKRKVYVRRAPGVVVVAPGIFAGTDGDETIVTVCVGQCVAAASEIGVERRVVLIHFVLVTPCGVRLPNFHHGVRGGSPVFIENPPANDDALPKWFAAMLFGEVEGFRVYARRADAGPGDFRQRVGKVDKGLRGSPLRGGNIGRMQMIGLRAGIRAAVSHQLRHVANLLGSCNSVYRRSGSAPGGWRKCIGRGRARSRMIKDASDRVCQASIFTTAPGHRAKGPHVPRQMATSFHILAL